MTMPDDKIDRDIHDALCESNYRAGVKAGWNAAQSDNQNAALASIMKYQGHLKPIRDRQKAAKPVQ